MICTVKAFAEKHKAEGWTEPRVRWAIFKSGQNGLEKSGGIVRFHPSGPGVGRGRIMIDEEKFFAVVSGGEPWQK